MRWLNDKIRDSKIKNSRFECQSDSSTSAEKFYSASTVPTCELNVRVSLVV